MKNNPPYWTDAILDFADGILGQQQEWDAYPILADMLEEAGCERQSFLAALRQGRKYRGGPYCWVQDEILKVLRRRDAQR